MSTWTLTSGASAQTFAQWGFEKVKRSTKSLQTGRVTFTDKTAKVDDDPKLAYRAPVTIQKDGAPWFSGIVTKTPRMASSRSEGISYEISDPWWFFEQLPFQQMWVTNQITGGAYATVSSARSRVTLGQSADGVKMNLGQIMTEVIYYVLYACAGVPFPTVVLSDTHLVAPPAFDNPPFAIGTLTPNVTIPYSEVTDKKCAEIIKLLMRWVPDATQWFDMTVVPPKLNICQRPTLSAKTISLFGGTVVSPNAFNPTPLDEMVAPAVIAKFEQVIDDDGTSKDFVTVDKYPAGVADNAIGALVMTVDLVGGSAVYQHQDIVVQNLPVSPTGTATMPWLQSHIPWLFGTVSKPSIYDIAGITCIDYYGFDIDPQDPFATGDAPSGFVVANMNKELIGGGITRWMEDDQEIYACAIVLCFRLRYTGSDATTAALFQDDPANPNTRIVYVRVTGTNADTQTYKQLTSSQPPEPVPIGLAQALYNALSVLHWNGSIMFKEPECSGQLPVGCVFNTSDGREEWATMNAQVLSVEEDVDKGVTTARFGPPLMLGLQDMVELLRAARGRIFSYKLDQRTSGEAGTSNAIIGHTRTPSHHTQMAPGGAAAAAPFPFQLTSQITTGASPQKQIKVQLNSTLYLQPNSGSNIAITGLDTWITVSGTGHVYLKGSVASGAVSGPTIATGASGGDFDPSLGPWMTGAFVENDGASPPNQTYLRVWIGDFDATGAGAPVITAQKLKNNLVLKNCQFNGLPAIYPESYA